MKKREYGEERKDLYGTFQDHSPDALPSIVFPLSRLGAADRSTQNDEIIALLLDSEHAAHLPA